MKGRWAAAVVLVMTAACSTGPKLPPVESPWTDIGFVWPAQDLELAFCSVGISGQATGQLSVHTSMSVDDVNAFYRQRDAQPATIDDALALGTATSSQDAWRQADRVSAWSLGEGRAVLVGPRDEGTTVINARFRDQSADVKCDFD